MRRQTLTQFASWREIIIVVWRGDDTEAGADALIEKLMEQSMDSRELFGILHIIEPDAAPPNAATRRRLNHVYKSYEKHLGFNLTTFEGDGFRAAAVRAVASGMARMARVSYPFEVHTSISSVSKRAVELLDYPPPTVLELLNAVTDARGDQAA